MARDELSQHTTAACGYSSQVRQTAIDRFSVRLLESHPKSSRNCRTNRDGGACLFSIACICSGCVSSPQQFSAQSHFRSCSVDTTVCICSEVLNNCGSNCLTHSGCNFCNGVTHTWSCNSNHHLQLVTRSLSDSSTSDGHGRLWPNRLWPISVFQCVVRIF